MAASATRPDGHVRKRQYQPSIASYFQRNADTGSSGNAQRPSASSLSPPLPAETQSSLLNVGMRIRKSVPEGYKTHKTLGTAGFPSPSTAPPKQTRVERPILSTQGSRELQPFCGLHKIGGWADQEDVYAPTSSAPTILQSARGGRDSWDVPRLTMSQSTLGSSQESFTSSAYLPASLVSNKKRTYEEETEEDIDAIFDAMDASDLDEDPVNADSDSSLHLADTLRLIAKPRRNAKAHSSTSSTAMASDKIDFEEAPFLQPLDGMDVR
ncbi:hypothetical protein K431DRAFT_280373 [Polychaeton citri CBS 116435]|uniref:Uncharacterized protein n=1 Tax=Polychaeton citri CBS 116435 TaxID=1314669 RepID=A0A9P4UTP8_9PEZI|nr:hypothetical protein K431DRAFT_280373 [Polychaeton citri CBS 116435]